MATDLRAEVDLIQKKLDVLVKDKAATSIYIILLLMVIAICASVISRMLFHHFKLEQKNIGVLIIIAFVLVVSIVLLRNKVNENVVKFNLWDLFACLNDPPSRDQLFRETWSKAYS